MSDDAHHDDHERRRRAFAEACAVSYEILAQPVETRAADPLREDSLVKWRRNMPEPPPAPKPRGPTAEEVNQLRSQDWVRFVDSRIVAAISDHDADLHEAIGAVVGQERQHHRDEIAKLKSDFDLRLSALLAELELVRRGFADRGDVDRGSDSTVIEVPQFLERKNNAA